MDRFEYCWKTEAIETFRISFETAIAVEVGIHHGQLAARLVPFVIDRDDKWIRHGDQVFNIPDDLADGIAKALVSASETIEGIKHQISDLEEDRRRDREAEAAPIVPFPD